MSEVDRREHPRFAYDVEAKLLLTGADPMPVRTMDISFSGICLLAPLAVQSGAWVQVELRLVQPGRSSDVLSLPAKVVWSTATAGEYQIGAKFSADLSAVHLARLDMLLQFLSGELDVPHR